MAVGHTYTIVPMEDAHSSSIIAIFNHYIENGFSSYFDNVFSEAFYHRLKEIAGGYPALSVKDDKGDIVGFAFLHAYHPAPTMKRTAEATYFIHHEHIGMGIGKALLEKLTEMAVSAGIDNIVASISSLNTTSLAFHEKNGFTERGRLVAVGKKHAQDFDVVYMQKALVVAVSAKSGTGESS